MLVGSLCYGNLHNDRTKIMRSYHKTAVIQWLYIMGTSPVQCAAMIWLCGWDSAIETIASGINGQVFCRLEFTTI